MPVIPSLQREGKNWLRVLFGHIRSSKPSHATWDPFLKRKKTIIIMSFHDLCLFLFCTHKSGSYCVAQVNLRLERLAEVIDTLPHSASSYLTLFFDWECFYCCSVMLGIPGPLHSRQALHYGATSLVYTLCICHLCFSRVEKSLSRNSLGAPR